MTVHEEIDLYLGEHAASGQLAGASPAAPARLCLRPAGWAAAREARRGRGRFGSAGLTF